MKGKREAVGSSEGDEMKRGTNGFFHLRNLSECRDVLCYRAKTKRRA